ncbi:hypothetical protein SVIOM342S_07796 [Streptomyces violaceorubidus]
MSAELFAKYSTPVPKMSLVASLRPPRTAAVLESRGVGGDAVADLVPGHVQRGQRVGVARAVAVGHEGAAVGPEGVDVVAAVVDAGVGRLAVVPDAAAAEALLVEVPGDLGAVGGVDGGGLVLGVAGGGAGAPGVVGVGEQGAGAGGLAGQVVRLVAAPSGVVELVRRARLGGAEFDRARVEALAGAGLDALVLVELGAGGGVGDDVQLVRCRRPGGRRPRSRRRGRACPRRPRSPCGARSRPRSSRNRRPRRRPAPAARPWRPSPSG